MFWVGDKVVIDYRDSKTDTDIFEGNEYEVTMFGQMLTIDIDTEEDEHMVFGVPLDLIQGFSVTSHKKKGAKDGV